MHRALRIDWFCRLLVIIRTSGHRIRALPDSNVGISRSS
jgi:hypothetical protein